MAMRGKDKKLRATIPLNIVFDVKSTTAFPMTQSQIFILFHTVESKRGTKLKQRFRLYNDSVYL
jgi:hypothetical protein